MKCGASWLILILFCCTRVGFAQSNCPAGFICKDGVTESCEEIRRRTRDDFLFGDLFAGIRCPEGENMYLNCPVGMFCPDSVTEIACPSGKFCPHKTAEPELKCDACGVGSKSLQRQSAGYFGIIAVGIAAVSYIIWGLTLRYNKRVSDKVKELQKRRLDAKMAPLIESQNQERLKRVRPQLELLVKRAREMQAADGAGGNRDEGSLTVKFNPDGTIDFDPGEFFYELYGDRDEVSYRELNKILKLNSFQLKEFVTRMNSLGGAPRDASAVSRDIFEAHFIRVFAESSNFGPTVEECAALYNSIARNMGVDREGSIPFALFYISELSTFLSDVQIHHIVSRFTELIRKQSRALQPTLLDRVTSRATSIGDVTSGRRGGTRNRERVSSPKSVGKDDFVKYYPLFLKEAAVLGLEGEDEEAGRTPRAKRGLDISFQHLSLTLEIGGKSIRVVDDVTGRLQPGTMTAIMGGSGAGKTSLLNALCGRASYGKVSGVTKINGKVADIDAHKSLLGFVPQDDIVYAELTVRENFLYSGRFRLPQGTDSYEIEDLADKTIASLGLTRVGHSIVGDVRRRGVSGGERKRVNIGLELMARPSSIVLDEPTSGLDASSAFLVMNCLRSLVDKEGLSACSVIHQPRKSIFDLFDSLILLGAGGKMVYHGPLRYVSEYFSEYPCSPGESIADWLIDISTGHLCPYPPQRSSQTMAAPRCYEGLSTAPPPPSLCRGQSPGLPIGLHEMGDWESSHTVHEEAPLPSLRRRQTSTYSGHCFHAAGPSSRKEEVDEEVAKARREELFEKWNDYFMEMSRGEREFYSAPRPYDIPSAVKKPAFAGQLWIQMKRYALVWRRNYFSKIIDTVVIIGASALISAMAGTAEVTVETNATIPFEVLTSTDAEVLAPALPEVYSYATLGSEELQRFGLKICVIFSVLIGLTAAKDITDKQTEFFREAASGYDVNAYFLAVNIMSSIEHLSQAFIAALITWWLRQSISMWFHFCAAYVVLAWFSTAWSLFLPLVVPPGNVVTVIGFFLAFFGLLFSGTMEPITFSNVADSPVLQIFSGLFSQSKSFIESTVVSEHRCLPEQSGFTSTEDAVNFPVNMGSFSLLGLAQNDDSVTDRTCSGWYVGLYAPIFVGFLVRYVSAGVIHVAGRSKQAKKPLRRELKERTNRRLRCYVLVYAVVLVVLFVIALWLILKDY